MEWRLSPHTCDVLVVGGGPAGLSAAIALRQQGADVLVAESLAPPIDKACGEGLMPGSLRSLGQLGVELRRERGADFEGILFASADSPVRVSARLAHGKGLGVRRLKLHEAMIERAEEIGVRLRWQAPVALNAGVPVTLDGAACRYQYLIGADGQTSRLRRWAGLEEGNLISRRFGFRRHYAVEPWSNFVEVHWATLGQAYITPVGKREICVAVVTSHRGVGFDRVIAGIPVLAERLGSIAPHTRERGCVTTTRRLRRVTQASLEMGKVALIGDASGSADAITGEGVAMGFRQAGLLAEAIRTDDLDWYEAGHAGILRRPQTMARAMLLMDRSKFVRDRALRLLEGRPDLFQKMLDVHLGEAPLARFVALHGLELGWRMIVSTPGYAD